MQSMQEQNYVWLGVGEGGSSSIFQPLSSMLFSEGHSIWYWQLGFWRHFDCLGFFEVGNNGMHFACIFAWVGKICFGASQERIRGIISGRGSESYWEWDLMQLKFICVTISNCHLLTPPTLLEMRIVGKIPNK